MLRIQIESLVAGVEGAETIMTTGSASVGNLVTGFVYERRMRPETVGDFALQDAHGNYLKNNRTVESYGLQDGDKLYLARRPPGRLLGCKNLFALAAFVFLISVVGFGVGIYLYSRQEGYPVDYVVVVDAGSTHTYLYVYQWSGEKLRNTGVVDQKASIKCEDKGLANYPSGREAASSIFGCLQFASNQIPPVSWESTEIFVGATAGMRILSIENKTRTEEILLSVTDLLRANFSFKVEPNNIFILSGLEEAAYGWISANFLTKLLFKRASPTSEYGSLDLGGASAQVAFEPKDPSILIPNVTFHTTLYGVDHSVYSQSYLCYGIREAERRLQALLVSLQNSTIVQNPCMPLGYSLTTEYDTIFGTHCTKNFVFPRTEDTIFFNGTSNPAECRRLVGRLFNTSSCPFPGNQCSFDGVFQPQLSANFMAFSGLYYIMEFLNLTAAPDPSGIVRLSDFRSKSVDFCRRSWSEINVLNATDPHNPFLATYCFEAQFVDTLLTDGYHFNETTFAKIRFLKDIDGKAAGWTLGLAVNSTNSRPVENPGHVLSTTIFAFLMLLFSVTLALSVFFLVKAVRKARRNHDYEPISTYGAI